MDEERSIILSMVSEGRLAPQEAELLLEALEPELGDVPDSSLALRAEPQAASHEQQPDWMTSLTTEQIIQLKIHGVNTAFVQRARQLGLGELSFEQLIELAIHGVDPAFVQQFRDMGLKDLTFRQLIDFAIHGVDADFVREMRELDLKDASSTLDLNGRSKKSAREACRGDG